MIDMRDKMKVGVFCRKCGKEIYLLKETCVECLFLEYLKETVSNLKSGKNKKRLSR